MSGDLDVGFAPALSRVVVSPDGDDYVIGRPDLAVFVVVPEPGAVFIEALKAGESLAEAGARASAVAGTEVDGEDFVAGLTEAGVLAMPGSTDHDEESVTPARGSGVRRVRWIEGVKPAAARRLFGPTAWSLYGLATAFVVVLLVVRPDMRPTYEAVWWLPDPVLSVLTVTMISIPLAVLHEAWHWLAGRAVGVPAVFRVSYRGIFLVVETDLTQIVTVPRRKRYSPFLAGMAFDVSVLAVALGLRLAHRVDSIHLAGWLDRLLAAVVLLLLLRIIWQWAAAFMRSDGYAVIANALRCHDLYRATWLTIKERMVRLTDAEAVELASMSPRDRRVARYFGIYYLAGMTAMAWVFVAFAVPVVISMIWWVGHNLLSPSVASVAFWESVAVIVVVVGGYAAVPALAWRERRLRQKGALR